ncbi:MAG: histidine phosphatase family protein [Myxococcota bacterium]|jgi:probable phosphoglycerate mutase|nr:histidine phosphatase family protein [Myxococcota bacterium]
MELLLIRHGLPLRVRTPDGTPADPNLSPTGHAQAERVAEVLARESIDRIYSSPMRRARETAAPLAAMSGLEVDIEPRIREFDAEADEYVPLEELKRTDPERWRAFMAGGYGSQSDFDAFVGEVVAGLQEVVGDNAGQRVAVFCHGGVINAWATHTLEIAPRLFLDAQYASINRFKAASSGHRSIASLNEAAHLADL